MKAKVNSLSLCICSIVLLLCFLVIFGCGKNFVKKEPINDDVIADAHFHNANYAMQGLPLQEIVDKFMGNKIMRSVVFPLPLQQKWNYFEHYAQDKIPPNYYLGPKAGMYYYSAIDAMTAHDYLKMNSEDKRRLDPMIVGFNPMDQYAVNHIKRMLILYPGVFTGIGEFSVHKELVGDKIGDDVIWNNLSQEENRPNDTSDSSRNTLYNPSLKTILDFADEAGLIVCLHSDIYPAKVSYDGTLISLSPESPYTDGMKHLCKQCPNTTVYWAHTGLGRYVKPAANHLQVVSEILESCPKWYADISWDLVQEYMINPKSDMPSLEDWAQFIQKYQDRILWGSDSVIYTKNKIDNKGSVVFGKAMSVTDYLKVKDILKPVWEKIGYDAVKKVKYSNYIRMFDAARAKVRSWESLHSRDNIWDIPVERK